MGSSRLEIKAFVNSALKWQGGCLLWPFGKRTPKYGATSWNGERWLAHRLICTLAHGEAPTPKHEAAHSCGVHLCCNPQHLRWATRSENMNDRTAHGTQNRGERCGMSKLTEEMVRAIRNDPRSSREAAPYYGVRHNTISRIRSGARWGWLV